MISKAVAKYVRISPRKTRLVTRLVSGLSVPKAYGILAGVNKKASIYINEVLMSAVNNAKRQNPNLNENDLYISKIVADGGPMLKRFRAASMGRASMIKKRTSHITICLDSKVMPKQAEHQARKSVLKRPIIRKDAKPKIKEVKTKEKKIVHPKKVKK